MLDYHPGAPKCPHCQQFIIEALITDNYPAVDQKKRISPYSRSEVIINYQNTLRLTGKNLQRIA